MIDLKDAFWACPLAEGSRDMFSLNGRTLNQEESNNFGGQGCPKDFLDL